MKSCLKSCLKLIALACVGTMTAATASSDEIEGFFVEATIDNTVVVADGSSPLTAGSPNWFAGTDGGIYGTGFNHNLLPDEIVTTIGGFTPGDVYNIGMVYTSLSFFTLDNLAAGHTSGVLTDVPTFHADVVGGALPGPSGTATAYDLNIGPQTVNADGELKLYVDDSSTSNSAATFLAYKGMTYSLVVDSVLGDVDQNGVVDFLDIGPFIAVLSSGGFQSEADVDGNGVVDFLDIGPFIALLSGA